MARFSRLKDVERGDFFVLPTRDEVANLPFGDFVLYVTKSRVLVRGQYDRSSKKYSYHHFCDICGESFSSGNTLVIVDFFF